MEPSEALCYSCAEALRGREENHGGIHPAGEPLPV
ncbi:hypothetical protein MHYP_G00088160 [Metynnis hypsauchen]